MTTPEPFGDGDAIISSQFINCVEPLFLHLNVVVVLFFFFCSRDRYKIDRQGAPSINRVVHYSQLHGVATGPKVTRIQQKFAPCLLTSVVSQSSVHARVQIVPSPTVYILKYSKYVVQCHSRLCRSVCS